MVEIGIQRRGSDARIDKLAVLDRRILLRWADGCIMLETKYGTLIVSSHYLTLPEHSPMGVELAPYSLASTVIYKCYWVTRPPYDDTDCTPYTLRQWLRWIALEVVI